MRTELIKKMIAIAAVVMTFAGVGLAAFFLDIDRDEKPRRADPNAVYRVTVRNNISAPIYDDTYYCAYYRIDDRAVTMYDADSAVIRQVIINVNANCDVKKLQ